MQHTMPINELEKRFQVRPAEIGMVTLAIQIRVRHVLDQVNVRFTGYPKILQQGGWRLVPQLGNLLSVIRIDIHIGWCTLASCKDVGQQEIETTLSANKMPEQLP
jgi:hypothetical protein